MRKRMDLIINKIEWADAYAGFLFLICTFTSCLFQLIDRPSFGYPYKIVKILPRVPFSVQPEAESEQVVPLFEVFSIAAEPGGHSR